MLGVRGEGKNKGVSRFYRRFFYDKINIIRRSFYYGKTKETSTSSTNMTVYTVNGK